MFSLLATAFPEQILVNCAIYFYHAIFYYSVYVLYVVQCGVQLTVWFNSANVMFNSLGCNISKLLSMLGLVNYLILY